MRLRIDFNSGGLVTGLSKVYGEIFGDVIKCFYLYTRINT